MKMILRCLVPCSLLIMTFVLTMSCRTRLEDKVKAFEDICNSHDVEKIISLYTEDAVHEVPGQFLLRGRKDLRGLAQYDSVSNTRFFFRQCEAEGDTVTCDFIATDDWIKTVGIEEAYYSAKFVFSDGLIKQWTAEPTPETAQALDQVFSSFVDWVSKEKPQQLKEMAPEGRFIYNAKNAKKSLKLLREWQESTH